MTLSGTPSWLEDCESSVVAVLKADSDLCNIAGKIEPGVFIPGSEQDIMGSDFPYVGVTATGFGPDSQETAGVSVHPVTVSVSLAGVGTPMADIKATIQRMLSYVHRVVGYEMVHDRFSLSNDTGEISVVNPGSGDILGIKADDGGFVVWGEYQWQMEYRLNVR